MRFSKLLLPLGSVLIMGTGCTLLFAPGERDPEEGLPSLDIRDPVDPLGPEGAAPETPGPGTPSPEAGPGTPEPGVNPEPEPCIQDADYFEVQIDPILNSCLGCHVDGGLAERTQMVFDADPTPAGTASRFNTLRDIALLSAVDTPLFVLKPTLQLPHTGGQLFAVDSPEAAALSEMSNRFRQPGNCGDPGGQSCSELPTFVQPTVRRLSNVELNRTLADLFPNATLPDLLRVANETRNFFDNQSAGSVNSNLVTQYDHINAQAISEVLATNLGALLPCDPSGGSVCGREFVREQGRRIFRRPLTSAEEDLYASFFETGPVSGDFDLAAQIALQAMLESPAFLYRLELGVDPDSASTQMTPYETATRLSYFIWGTTPDTALLDAAESGELATPQGVAVQVDRMLADARATEGLMHLFNNWLDTPAVANAQKDASANFNDAIRRSLIEESERFLREIVLAESPTLETLLTSNETFIDDNIASIYGLQGQAPNAPGAWARVTHAEPRFGVLTQGAFLASRGHAFLPSPIKRSNFILARLMCFDIGSPPQEAEGAVVTVTGEETNRQATDALTMSGSCRGCHSILNPLGYSLERYGTTGAMQSTDNGQPIDDSGMFAIYAFDGAEGLANMLNESSLVSHCVAERFSQYALGHSLSAGECFVSDVEQAFSASGNDFYALVRAIATHPAFAFGTLDKSYAGGAQ